MSEKSVFGKKNRVASLVGLMLLGSAALPTPALAYSSLEIPPLVFTTMFPLFPFIVTSGGFNSQVGQSPAFMEAVAYVGEAQATPGLKPRSPILLEAISNQRKKALQEDPVGGALLSDLELTERYIDSVSGGTAR